MGDTCLRIAFNFKSRNPQQLHASVVGSLTIHTCVLLELADCRHVEHKRCAPGDGAVSYPRSPAHENQSLG